jgi:lysophospholipase L1-like esterase
MVGEIRSMIAAASRRFLFGFLPAMLASCVSNSSPAIRTRPHVIVIFGDSTSAVRPNVRVFSSFLQERLPEAKIINAGVPGNTTRDALVRLDRDVISQHPDIVTIFFGINDSAVDVWKGATEPRVPLAEYRANLGEMITAIRGAGATPILLTPSPVAWTCELLKLYGRAPYQPDNPDGWNVELKQYAAAVRQIAVDQRVLLVDVDGMFREYAAEPGHHLGDLLLDGMHPNDMGHRLIAEGILKNIN